MSKTEPQSDADLPLVFRYKELRPDGYFSWFVASLQSDGEFWGQVHYRTDTVSKNRSFVGKLEKLKLEQITQVINSAILCPVQIPADGLVGRGTRTNFKTLMSYNRESEQTDRFMEIVSVLLPESRLALGKSA